MSAPIMPHRAHTAFGHKFRIATYRPAIHGHAALWWQSPVEQQQPWEDDRAWPAALDLELVGASLAGRRGDRAGLPYYARATRCPSLSKAGLPHGFAVCYPNAPPWANLGGSF
jgi:hypothetical protein